MNRPFPVSRIGVFVLSLICSGSTANAQEIGGARGESSGFSVIATEGESSRDVAAIVRGTGLELTADLAAQIASSAAPSIEQASALLAAARAGADRARNGFIPQLDVIASYTRVPSSKGYLVPDSVMQEIQSVSDPAARNLWYKQARVLKNRYLVRGILTFPVSDYFLELWPRYKFAKGFEEARELGVRAEQVQVELSAREAYYSFALARAAAAVQRSTLEEAEQFAQLVDTRARQGQIHRVEVLRMRAELEGARVALLRSEGGVEIAGTALRAMLDLEPGTAISLAEDLFAELPPDIESAEVLTNRAMSTRAEARALRQIIGAHAYAVDAAKGSRLPSLVVQSQLEYGSPNPYLFLQLSEPEAVGFVSVFLTWSLEDTMEGGPAAAEQSAARDQARADLRGLEVAIRSQVAEARVAYQTAVYARSAAELSHEAAQESHRLQVAEFERGRALPSQLLEAVATLARAELGLLSAAIDGRVALARLERAVGAAGVATSR